MKISVCTDALFGGMSTPDAMEAVHSCGIHAVEFWDWWGKDIDAIDQKRRELGMEIAAFCTRFVSLTDPSCREEYLEGLKETIEVAKKLGCKRIISQVGNDTGKPREEQRQSLIEGLKCSVPYLEAAGCELVVEPLNIRVDHAGYFLWASDEAAAILEAVGSPSVRMLFDCYHQQIMEGDIIRRATTLIDWIDHVHVAGNPGRHEPECGEINYKAVFEALDEAGYTGYVGFEFFPVGDAKACLKYWSENASGK